MTYITVDTPTMIYPIAVCGRDRTPVQVSASLQRSVNQSSG